MGDSIAEKIAELKARKDKLFQERTEKAGRQFEANKEIGELTGELLVLFALPDLAIEPEILWSFYLRLATECDLRIYYGMGGATRDRGETVSPLKTCCTHAGGATRG